MALRTGHDLPDATIAQRYSTLSSLGIWPADFYARVLDAAGTLEGRRVLEIGCGRGGLLAALSTRGAAEVQGVDFVETYVAEAAQRGGPNVRVRTANLAEALPYPAGAFDVVFAMEVLEHLKVPERCLGEVHRVLSPGGRLVLSIPNATAFAPFHRLGSVLPGRWLKQKLLPYEHPSNTEQPIDTMYTYREILALVARAGFVVERQSGYRYFRYALGFPILRSLYTPWAPQLERWLERHGWQRFAYHLILRCRPSG